MSLLNTDCSCGVYTYHPFYPYFINVEVLGTEITDHHYYDVFEGLGYIGTSSMHGS